MCALDDTYEKDVTSVNAFKICDSLHADSAAKLALVNKFLTAFLCHEENELENWQSTDR